MSFTVKDILRMKVAPAFKDIDVMIESEPDLIKLNVKVMPHGVVKG